MPDLYLSTAVLRAEPGVDPARVGGLVAAASREVFRQKALGEMIESENLYPTERLRLPLEDMVERMRTTDIRVSPVAPGAIEVQYLSGDPVKAQRVNAILAERLRQTATEAKLQTIGGESDRAGALAAQRRGRRCGAGVGRRAGRDAPRYAIKTVGAPSITIPPWAVCEVMRVAGNPPASTVGEPWRTMSGGPTQTHMSVMCDWTMPIVITVTAPGPMIGPPTCGIGTTAGVIIGQMCMSVILDAGKPMLLD